MAAAGQLKMADTDQWAVVAVGGIIVLLFLSLQANQLALRLELAELAVQAVMIAGQAAALPRLEHTYRQLAVAVEYALDIQTMLAVLTAQMAKVLNIQAMTILMAALVAAPLGERQRLANPGTPQPTGRMPPVMEMVGPDVVGILPQA